MLTLRYKSDTTIPVEAEVITPNQLADKSSTEIARLPVQHGNATVPLGEFFDVEGRADDQNVLLEGDCSRVKWIGAGMTSGRITIQGNVGMHLGAEMEGGEIEVHGNAGDWVGAEMQRGRIHVHGNAGHLIGSAYRGAHVGMRGGTILVDGNVGNEIGSHLRRGLIAIGGDSGDFAGIAMIAGSIFIFGQPGQRMGAGMKRGTIAVFEGEPSLLPTFRYNCQGRLTFLTLYLQQLHAWGFRIREDFFGGKWKRYSGDLVSLGKGEVLTWQDS